MSEKENKKCPLFGAGSDGYCSQESCEWWNDIYSGCAIHAIFMQVAYKDPEGMLDLKARLNYERKGD